MSNPNQPSELSAADARQPAVPRPGRRRLLQGGLAAAPVVLTLVSRPVLGAGVECQTASAFTSANASRPGTAPVCSGRSPAYWTQHPEEWPAPYVARGNNAMVFRSFDGLDDDAPDNRAANGASDQVGALGRRNGSTGTTDPAATKFHSGTTGCGGAFFGGKPMMEVMQMQGGGLYDFAAHIGAALLNAAAGLTPVLDENGVRSMWNSYVSNGYYEPTAGVKWYCEECCEYLQSTMI